MQQRIEYYFFKDCDSFFEKKIRSFHKNFIDDCLFTGVGDFNADLDSVKMARNKNFSLSFCERVVEGMSFIDPLIVISHVNDGKIETNCVIYYLNDQNDFEGFYMLQKVNNWNGSKKTSHQVWALFEDDIFEINAHWLY
jgi:hypothetical protein